jgi:hypothetical protein
MLLINLLKDDSITAGDKVFDNWELLFPDSWDL